MKDLSPSAEAGAGMKPGTPSASMGAGSPPRSTRASLCADVSGRLGVPEAQAREVLEALLASLASHLADGDRLNLRGFGVFDVRVRKARGNVRNPRTGAACPPMRARRVVSYRPYWALMGIV